MKVRRRHSSVLVVVALVVVGVVVTGCLPEGTVLHGTLTSTNAGASAVAGVPVVAYSDTDQTPVASTITDSAGNYLFSKTSLPEGTYRLRFGDGYWFSDATSWETATAVRVSASDPVSADATFDVPSGGLTGSVDNGSDPIAGIVVYAVRKATGEVVAQVTTDAAGNFAFAQLYPQTYSLVFMDPNQKMLGVVWGSQSSEPTSGIGFAVTGGTVDDYGVFGLVGKDCTPGRSSAGADLAGAILINCDLSYADLTGTDFTGADLKNADLAASQLSGAHIEAANFDGASLYYVQSGGVSGTPATLPSGWMLAHGYLIGPGASLEGAQLGSADLTGVSLQFSRLVDANLVGATVTSANLGGANLSRADLGGADFTDAIFVQAHLDNANLSTTVLSGADLTGASMTNVNLDGADLTGATLTDVVSGGIIGTPAALPAGWSLVDGDLVGPAAAS